MRNNILAEIAEEDIPTQTINLIPSIKQKYLEKNTSAKAQYQRLRIAASLSVLALVTVVVFLVVPPARAMINGVLQGLGLELVDDNFFENATTMQPEPTYSGDNFIAISHEDLSRQTPFALHEPDVPAGLQYLTGKVEQNNNIVVVTRYYTTDIEDFRSNAPILMIEVTNGDLSPWLFSEDAVELVSVNGTEATYIHGGWADGTSSSDTGSADELVWNPTIDAAILAWSEDGLRYRIQAHGLGLALEELIRIAESLTS